MMQSIEEQLMMELICQMDWWKLFHNQAIPIIRLSLGMLNQYYNSNIGFDDKDMLNNTYKMVRKSKK